MMGARDRTAMGLVTFFIVCAFSLELYWLVYRKGLPERGDLLARAYAFYARGDPGFYDPVGGFDAGLESFNILFTQPLHVGLLFGIVRRRAWRYPLQLGVCSYVCYSTTLYLVANHVSGYAETPRHDPASLLILYLPNMPWVMGNLWLAWDAAREIARAFRTMEAA